MCKQHNKASQTLKAACRAGRSVIFESISLCLPVLCELNAYKPRKLNPYKPRKLSTTDLLFRCCSWTSCEGTWLLGF